MTGTLEKLEGNRGDTSLGREHSCMGLEAEVESTQARGGKNTAACLNICLKPSLSLMRRGKPLLISYYPCAHLTTNYKLRWASSAIQITAPANGLGCMGESACVDSALPPSNFSSATSWMVRTPHMPLSGPGGPAGQGARVQGRAGLGACNIGCRAGQGPEGPA